jgi:hypothetical protein
MNSSRCDAVSLLCARGTRATVPGKDGVRGVDRQAAEVVAKALGVKKGQVFPGFTASTLLGVA